MNAKTIIGLVIIGLTMIWGISSFLDSTIVYVSIAEAKTSSEMVQVMGKISKDEVSYNTDESRLEFTIYDADAETAETAERLRVVYYGVVPGNFDQATSVVAKGINNENEFVADKLLVKCPSKYQGEDGEEYQDIKKHQGGIMSDTIINATPDSAASSI
ncbi:MAG: cytochrome c maturation protein CcmE [candidate division Zixibacteria bacterium]|nr:cytochrome c maturation protein CcmE [candidate division Zixibacteria bacterium]